MISHIKAPFNRHSDNFKNILKKFPGDEKNWLESVDFLVFFKPVKRLTNVSYI